MNIRLYNHKTDKSALIELLNDVFTYDAPHNDPLTSIERKIEQKDNLLFVAESDTYKIVGTVMVGYDGHRGWIYSLGVLPEYRKEGIGTMLMKYAETELKKLNCPKIKLQILPFNKEVTSFYKKNGFIVEESILMGKILK